MSIAFPVGPSFVRLYHDTEFYGAWVCIPDRRWIYNLGNYRFNNGAGRSGYGQVVADNFKSVAQSYSGSCTNPARPR